MSGPQSGQPAAPSVASINNAVFMGTLATDHFSGLMLSVVTMHVHIHPADPVGEEERDPSRV